MMGLEGRRFGPSPFVVSAERVADFVEVTGDDPNRWTDAAPPGFAAAALFEVAPFLLAEIDGSVIHGEQSFTWLRPLAIGSDLEVVGTVPRVRERGGVHYITFDIAAGDAEGEVVTGSSLFLVTGDALPASADFERPEPHHSFRGEAQPEQRSASRADLVRYASATRDWNPIHWDHGAAVAAGLPGVVVHGLLQAAWALELAARGGVGATPLAQARIRFRTPLLPARPVSVGSEREADVVTVVISDVDNEFLSARVELSVADE